MLFNSYIFVLGFLPVVLLGWYALNNLKRFFAAKIFLVLASLCFYGYVNCRLLSVILLSVFINFALSKMLLCRKECCIKLRKFIFFLSLTINIGSLFVFKYFDFFIENINQVFKTSLPLMHIALPLGISYFTFQQIAYTVDSYKRIEEMNNYNFWDYMLFITYFPKLVAGPIVTHKEMIPQFADVSRRKFNPENFAKGIWAFTLGLGKKVIIADSFGLLVDAGYADISKLGTVNALLVMLAYTFQIYFDFSGYCDMATGIGKMMNIDIAINFNSPYKAIGIVDFWKRWHITLTNFFTKYIYIPLGGNRKGKARTYVNIMIVFLISGIWHGANWTFIIWGLLHGVANVATKIIDGKTNLFSQNRKTVKLFLWFITFAFINLTWVVFRSQSFAQAGEFYRQLFDFGSILSHEKIPVAEFLKNMYVGGFELFDPYIPKLSIIVPAGIFLFAFTSSIVMKNTNKQIEKFRPTIVKSIFACIILYWCIMSFGTVSSFLYWTF